MKCSCIADFSVLIFKVCYTRRAHEFRDTDQHRIGDGGPTDGPPSACWDSLAAVTVILLLLVKISGAALAVPSIFIDGCMSFSGVRRTQRMIHHELAGREAPHHS